MLYIRVFQKNTSSHTSYKSLPPLPAVAYLFQAGVPFSTENTKWTACRKVYSETKNTNLHIFCDENIRCTIPNSKCNSKYNIPMPQTPITPKNMNIMHAKNIQCTPNKTPSTPNKTPSAQFQSKDYAKKTNIDLRCSVAM